ncbi:MAG: S8 family peptidase [Candidatus Ranarchaeia archaeon]
MKIRIRSKRGFIFIILLLIMISPILFEVIYLTTPIKSNLNSTPIQDSPPSDFGLPSYVIGSSKFYEDGINGSEVIIAILGTGIDSSHPDLDDLDDNDTTDDPKVIGSVSFVEGDPTTLDLSGHGTYCAGLVAGTGRASNGRYKGIAPAAKLLNVKVLIDVGFGYSSWIASGINWATDNGADIILMPFSTFGFPGDEVDEAIKEAHDLGVLVISAAGDQGPNFMSIMGPGASSASLTIGAYDFVEDTVPSFSSRGSSFELLSKPDLIAPGVNIVSTSVQSTSLGIAGSDLNLGGLDFTASTGESNIGDFSSLLGGMDLSSLSGKGIIDEQYSEYYSIGNTTAASAAITAGAAALLIQRSSQATVDEIRLALQSTAKSLNLGPNIEGAGLINVTKAAEELDYDPLSINSRNTGIQLPYFGFAMSQSPGKSAIMLQSQYAMSSILLLNHSRLQQNITSLHLIMANVYLSHENLSASPLYFSAVKNNFHYVTLPTAQYARYVGVLQYGDLIISPLLETWQMGTEDEDLNSFRLTINVLNIGNETINDLKIHTTWKLDLFMDESEAETDDFGSFNSTTNTLYIEDSKEFNETIVNVCFGLNSSTEFSSFEVGNYSLINDKYSEGFSNTTVNGKDLDIGWGTIWSLGDLPEYQVANLSYVFGMGDNRTSVDRSINQTWFEQPETIAPDMSIIEVEVPRSQDIDNTYLSTITIMNLGNNYTAQDSLAAFFVNQTKGSSGSIFITYHQIGEIIPFNITRITTSWKPETEDIYSIGWIAAPSLGDIFSTLATGGMGSGGIFETQTADLYLLDNFLLRDVFINVVELKAAIFPNKTPYAPYHIEFPTNFGLYTINIITTKPLYNVTIDIQGNATSWISLDTNNFSVVNSLTSFSLTVFAPPIIPAAIYIANITISSDNYQNITGVFKTQIRYPKARLLMDTTHNEGIGLDSGLDVSGDVTNLLSSFDEISDSIYVGYYELYRTISSLGITITEIPNLDTINNSMLQNFDGYLVIDPEKDFTLEEQKSLYSYILDDQPVFFFINDDTESEVNGINNILLNYNLEIFGRINGSLTSNLDKVGSPQVFNGVNQISYYNGASILSNITPQITSYGKNLMYYKPSSSKFVLFGSAETFSDAHIKEENNLQLLINIINSSYDNLLTLSASVPTDGEPEFLEGTRVYIDLLIENQTGDGIDDLTVFAAFYLPNGNLSYIFAAHMFEGYYSTFYLPLFYNGTGEIYIIFIVQGNDEYIGSYASTKFIILESEQESPIPKEETLLEQYYLLISTVGVVLPIIFLLSYYLLSKRKYSQKMKVPELREEFVSEVDNTLNLLDIHFKSILKDLENLETDRLHKVIQVFDQLDELKPTLDKLKKMARDIGGK